MISSTSHSSSSAEHSVQGITSPSDELEPAGVTTDARPLLVLAVGASPSLAGISQLPSIVSAHG